jgi:microcystin degradation protein MlrC
MSNKNPIITKVWVTKYALTTGVITQNNVELCTSISDKMILCLDHAVYFKPYWHTTRDEAVRHVWKMIDAKLASLAKIKAVIRKMDPETIVPK